MNWRKATVDDLPACLAIKPACAGAEIVGADSALRAWRALHGSPAFTAAVVEGDGPPGDGSIVGFGASVFVTRQFADREIASPAPGLNSRIIASVATADSVVLDYARVCAANSQDGLNLVVLASACREDLDSAGLADVRVDLGRSFLALHAGYRLRQMLVEANDVVDIEHARSTAVFAVVSDFAGYHRAHPDNRWNRDRVLLQITREQARSVTGSISGIVFQHRDPVLGLRAGEQLLLTGALDGKTDRELAESLDLKMPTVKKRWASVFGRVLDVKPDRMPAGFYHEAGGIRGPQKRHYLLSYVRDHPEELRPHAIAPARDPRAADGPLRDRIVRARNVHR